MANLTQTQLMEELKAEQLALTEIVARVSEEQWHGLKRADGWSIHDIVAHVGDASFSLAQLAEKGPQARGPSDMATMMKSIHERNVRRQRELASLSRDQIEGRLASGFSVALRVIDQSTNLLAPGPLGPSPTLGEWLQRIAIHSAQHREQLKELLGG